MIAKRTKYPKRLEINVEAQHIGYTENINITLPEEYEIEKTLIPEEKQNLNAIYLRTPAFTLTFYKDTEKCFVYTVKGKFLGALEKQDLKKAFTKIGTILKLVKNVR